MPIPVVCASCNAKLNAPDAAAGMSLKCPKCKGAITVPDPAAAQFEVVDEEPAPPPKAKPAAPAKKKPVVVEDDDDDDEDEKPKPKKKPVIIVEDDDEDEDEKPKSKKKPRVEEDDEEEDDEKPRKKKKKKLVSAVDSGNMARNIVGIVVLVIALGFVAYIWWDRNKEKDEKAEDGGTPSQPQTPLGPAPKINVSPGPPTGAPQAKWSTFQSAAHRIQFPGESEESTRLLSLMGSIGVKVAPNNSSAAMRPSYSPGSRPIPHGRPTSEPCDCGRFWTPFFRRRPPRSAR